MTSFEPKTQEEQMSASLPGLILSPKAIWRWKWCLLLSTVVAGAAGAAYLKHAPTTYQGRARIIVEKLFPSMNEVPYRRDPYFIPNQVETIRSPLVVAPALQAIKESDDGKLSQEEIDLAMALLDVSAIAGTNVVCIEYNGTDSRGASRFVDALIQSYLKHVQGLQKGTYLETHTLLSRQEDELRKEVRRLGQDLLRLRESSPLIGRGRDALEIQLVQLKQLAENSAAAQVRRIELENTLSVAAGLPPGAEIRTVTGTTPKPLENSERGVQHVTAHTAAFLNVPVDRIGIDPAVSMIPVVGTDSSLEVIGDSDAIQAELLAADARAKQLSQRYGPKHAAQRAVVEEINFWRSMLQKNMHHELERARRTEVRLADVYDKEFRAVKSLNVFRAREEQLIDDIRRADESHKLTSEKLRNWELSKQAMEEGRGMFDVRILEQPKEFADLIWPRPSLFLAVCVMIGLAVGAVPMVLSGSKASV